MTWIHVTGPICGVKGDVVHAIAHPLDGSKTRKTRDAVCGTRVTIAGAPTTDGDTMSLVWPPYVKGAESLGLTRCLECYIATGRSRLNPDMGTADWRGLSRCPS